MKITFILILLVALTSMRGQEHIEPYTVWFDSAVKLPKKVTYTVKKPVPSIKRKGYFRGAQGTLSPKDYRGSGYDRGHLFPAAKARTKKHLFNSFNMKNIVPQHPSLNRGVWKSLEFHVTQLSVYNDSVCVEVGLIGKISYRGSLPIPEGFYKIVSAWKNGKVRSKVYHFRNEKPLNSNFRTYQIGEIK